MPLSLLLFLTYLLGITCQSACQEALREYCILGAGPSGLSTAVQLLNKGKSVVVLETSHKLGGKAHSRSTKTSVADIGPSTISPDAYELLQLIQQYKIPTKGASNHVSMDENGDVSAFVDMFASSEALQEVAIGLEHYIEVWTSYSYNYPEISHDVPLRISPILHKPAMEFLTADDALTTLLPLFVYSLQRESHDLYEMDTFQFLRVLSPSGFLTALFPELGAIKPTDGYHSLWEKMANDIPDIKFGVSYKDIRRPDVHTANKPGQKFTPEGMIDVKFTQQSDIFQQWIYHCSNLIVAFTPTEGKLQTLGLSERESQIFSHVKTTSVAAVVAEINHKPLQTLSTGTRVVSNNGDDGLIGVSTGGHATGDGHVIHHKINAQETHKTDTELKKSVLKKLKNSPLKVTDVHEATVWRDHHSHVPMQSSVCGFQRHLNQIQGYRNTYYVSPFITQAGDSVESALRASKWVVQNFFSGDSRDEVDSTEKWMSKFRHPLLSQKHGEEIKLDRDNFAEVVAVYSQNPKPVAVYQAQVSSFKRKFTPQAGKFCTQQMMDDMFCPADDFLCDAISAALSEVMYKCPYFPGQIKVGYNNGCDMKDLKPKPRRERSEGCGWEDVAGISVTTHNCQGCCDGRSACQSKNDRKASSGDGTLSHTPFVKDAASNLNFI